MLVSDTKHEAYQSYLSWRASHSAEQAQCPDNERVLRGLTTHLITNTSGQAGQNASAACSHWNQLERWSERGMCCCHIAASSPVFPGSPHHQELWLLRRSCHKALVLVLKSRHEDTEPLQEEISYRMRASTGRSYCNQLKHFNISGWFVCLRIKFCKSGCLLDVWHISKSKMWCCIRGSFFWSELSIKKETGKLLLLPQHNIQPKTLNSSFVNTQKIKKTSTSWADKNTTPSILPVLLKSYILRMAAIVELRQAKHLD